MTNTERFAAICSEMTALYDRKNHDYGDSFHMTFLEEGMAMARIRLSDKLNRVKTLTRGGEDGMTNAEWIRSMCDETLAEFLWDSQIVCNQWDSPWPRCEEPGGDEYVACWLEWLRQKYDPNKEAALVTDESIRDTLLDLANYAVMTVMELDREKEAAE